jgi:hypothetical protein
MINIFLKMDVLTRLFIGYFLNKLDIDFNERKFAVIPTEISYFDCDYISFPILLSDIHLFSDKNVFNLFNDEIIPVINLSSHWKELNKIKDDKSLKVNFIEQPDNPPFPTSCITDMETGIKIRGQYGLLFGQEQPAIIFDMLIYIERE